MSVIKTELVSYISKSIEMYEMVYLLEFCFEIY